MVIAVAAKNGFAEAPALSEKVKRVILSPRFAPFSLDRYFYNQVQVHRVKCTACNIYIICFISLFHGNKNNYGSKMTIDNMNRLTNYDLTDGTNSTFSSGTIFLDWKLL